jgi:transmembrane sensor
MERLQYLLKKYYTNTCSKEELTEFLDTIQDPNSEPLLDDALHDAFKKGELYDINKSQLQFDDLKKAIKIGRPPVKDPQPKLWNWGIAASLVFLVSFAVTMYVRSIRTEVPGQTAVSTQPMMLKSTQTERRLIILHDGSSVWLNKESKLQYPDAFSENRREVSLTGEAYFDIKPDASRPFVIHSGEIKTTVLGTAFNIRAFPEEASVVVTVTHGRVRVEDNNRNKKVLTDRQQLLINVASNKVIQQQVADNTVTKWKEEDFILDNITFAEARKLIQDRYGVEIVFKNQALKSCRFTSTFLKDASLNQILTTIRIVNRATFEIEGNTISIEGEGCESD